MKNLFVKKLKKIITKNSFMKTLVISNLFFSIVPIIVLGIWFCNIYVGNMRKTIYEANASLFNQISYRINDYFEKTIATDENLFLNSSLQKDILTYDASDDSEMRNRIVGQLDTTRRSNKDIKAIFFLTNSGKIIDTGEYSLYNEIYPTMRNILQTQQGSGKTFFKYMLSDKTQDSRFILYRYVRGVSSDTVLKPIGVSAIVCDVKNIRDIFANNTAIYQSSYFLLDNENKIIASALAGGLSEVETSLADIKDGTITEIQDSKFLQQTSDVGYTKWKLAAFTPYKVIDEKTGDIIKLILIVIFILTVFLIATLLFLNMEIASPIKQLTEAFKIVSAGDRNYRISHMSNNEFKIIEEGFNEMLDQSNELTRNIFNTQQKLYEAELSKSELLMDSLQQQINSHFLFNTLTTIRGMALNNKTDSMAVMINSLVAILRYSTQKADFTSLGDEMKYIDVYLKIQNARYSNRFALINNISDMSLLECRTIKLILQPFIENAIMHAFKETQETCVITIDARKEETALVVSISDNGCGMSGERLSWLREKLDAWDSQWKEDGKRNIGLANVQKRLKIYCGEEYGLSVKSETGKGTTFYLKMTYQKND